MNWIKIPGINYEISDDCKRVRSLNYKKRGIATEIKGSVDKNGYRWFLISINGIRKRLGLHHLSYRTFVDNDYLPSGHKLVLDHIDNDVNNNKPSNLQLITQRENSIKDKFGKKSSKYVGVCWSKVGKKWTAQIKINGKKKHLGSFDDEYEAFLTYKKELEKICGIQL